MATDCSILVVEDEPAIREGLQDFLAYHGYRVTIAEDGSAAERTVREDRFDLILLDLMLPHVSGEQLCEPYHRLGPRSPVATAVMVPAAMMAAMPPVAMVTAVAVMSATIGVAVTVRRIIGRMAVIPRIAVSAAGEEQGRGGKDDGAR